MTTQSRYEAGHRRRPPLAPVTQERQFPSGTRVLTRSLVIDRPRAEVFQFFATAENLGVVTPPELRFEILSELPISMAEGTHIEYRIRLHGIPMTWRTLIDRWEPPHLFQDSQLKGPYRMWVHRHEFEDLGESTRMLDTVWYRLPVMGPLNALVHPLVRRQLDQIFDYRADAVSTAFDRSRVA
jgi:ligand-binding SRPBCC domain-containing protein